MNLPNQPAFPLYSVPVIVFNGIDSLFPSEARYLFHFPLIKGQILPLTGIPLDHFI